MEVGEERGEERGGTRGERGDDREKRGENREAKREDMEEKENERGDIEKREEHGKGGFRTWGPWEEVGTGEKKEKRQAKELFRAARGGTTKKWRWTSSSSLGSGYVKRDVEDPEWEEGAHGPVTMEAVVTTATGLPLVVGSGEGEIGKRDVEGVEGVENFAGEPSWVHIDGTVKMEPASSTVS